MTGQEVKSGDLVECHIQGEGAVIFGKVIKKPSGYWIEIISSDGASPQYKQFLDLDMCVDVVIRRV